MKTNRNLKYFFDNPEDEKIKILQQNAKTAVENFENKYSQIEKKTNDLDYMLEALKDYEKLFSDPNLDWNVSYYFFLAQTLDASDTQLQAKSNLAQNFDIEIWNKLIFFSQALKKMPSEHKKNILNDKRFWDYKHFLEKIFEYQKHSLTADQEILLNSISKPATSNWEEMVEKFLSTKTYSLIVDWKNLGKKTITQALALLSDKDEKKRLSASKIVDKINKHFSAVATYELNSLLEYKMQLDRLQNFPRPDSSRHLADDIDTKVVDAMLEAVEKNNKISHDYYKLKSKLFDKKILIRSDKGQNYCPKIKYYERNLELETWEKKYDWSETYNLVKDVFYDLDESFGKILEKLVEGEKVDVYPKQWKRWWAFCISWPLFSSTFVMLNHSDRLNDVLTFAHEMGHAINSELIKQNQNALNDSTPLSTAEVASTFFEDFVLKKLLEKMDDEQKLGILMHRLNDDISTIFRQVACYRFEQDLHKNFREKGFLSTENINQLFEKNMKAYIWDSVEFEKSNQYWWVYWSHIRNYFYVYSYASGLLISKSMQDSVKKDKNYISKVKQFLSAWSYESPKNIFQNLGIDIEDEKFWLQWIDQISKTLLEAEKLAKKLWKI